MAAELPISNDVLHMYKNPFDGPDARLPVSRVLAFNIPRMAFTPTGERWKDLVDQEGHKTFSVILFTLAKLTSRMFSGDRSLYIEGLPRVIIAVEELISEFPIRKPNLEGFRIWIFSIDNEANYARELGLLISDMKKLDEQTDKGTKKQRKTYELYRNLTSISTVATQMWNLYTDGELMADPNADDNIHSPANAAIGEDASILNPYNILKPERAMNLHVRDVCPTQRSLNSYFGNDDNGMDGAGAQNFGRFPYPDRVYQIPTRYFAPEFLYHAPLPTYMSEIYFQKLTNLTNQYESTAAQLNDINIKIDQFKQERDLEPNDMIQRLRELEYNSVCDDELDTLLVEWKTLQRKLEILTAELKAHPLKQLQKINALVNPNSACSRMILSGVQLEEEFAKSNEFIKARLKNSQVLEQIKAEILRKPDLKEKYDDYIVEYNEQVNEFRRKAIKETYDIFMTSKNVTDPIISARIWWQGLADNMHFVSLPQNYSNLSLFGNMIVQLQRTMDKVKDVKTQFHIAVICYINVMCTYRYTGGTDAKKTIKPTMMITGQPGCGKSFAMRVVGELALPGTTLSAVHMTKLALTGDTDFSDVHTLCEETPLWMLGIGHDGRDIPEDPIRKNQMSSGINVSVTQKKTDDGTRKTQVHYSRCAGNGTYATNPALSNSATGLDSRHINIAARKKNSSSSEKSSASMSMHTTHNHSIEDAVSHIWHIHHAFLMFWEQCITTLAMPDIDTSLFEFYSSIVFKYISKRNLVYPSERHRAMALEMTRALQMFYGIHAEFFSELGHQHRTDAAGIPKTFDPSSFFHLIKWGVVNQETSLFVLTLLEEVWVPSTKHEIARICGEKCLKPDQWPANENTPYRVIQKEFNGPKTIDYHYIELTDTKNSMIAAIQQHMKNGTMSPHDIIKSLTEMQGDFIESQEKDIYVDDEYQLRVEHHKLIEIEEKLRCLRMTNHEISEQIMRDFSSESDSDSDCSRMPMNESNDGIDSYAICQELLLLNERISVTTAARDAIARKVDEEEQKLHRLNEQRLITGAIGARPKVLRDKIGGKKEKIPCVRMESDPKDRSKRRLYISIDFIKQSFSNIFKDAIRSIQHKFQYDRTFITGFPHETMDSFGNTVTWYQFFAIMRMQKNDGNTVAVSNKQSLNKLDILNYNTVIGNLPATHFDERSIHVVDEDPEEIVMQSYWDANGLDPDYADIAHPVTAKKMVWRMREIHDLLPEARALIEFTAKYNPIYPDYEIEKLMNDKKEENTLSTNEGRESARKNGKYLLSDMRERPSGSNAAQFYVPTRVDHSSDTRHLEGTDNDRIKTRLSLIGVKQNQRCIQKLPPKRKHSHFEEGESRRSKREASDIQKAKYEYIGFTNEEFPL